MKRKISLIVALSLLSVTQQTICSYPKNSAAVSHFMQDLRAIAAAAVLKTEAIFFPKFAYAGQPQRDKPVAEPTDTSRPLDTNAIINGLPLSPKGKKLTAGYFTLYKSFLENFSQRRHSPSEPKTFDSIPSQQKLSVSAALPPIEPVLAPIDPQPSAQSTVPWWHSVLSQQPKANYSTPPVVPITPEQQWWQYQTSKPYGSNY